MRVGILDILTTPAQSWAESLYDSVIMKQYACITPQAISVWCRQLGHQTFYATYYGVGDPGKKLPRDLDILFISTATQASPLACVLSRLYRRNSTLTVIGGAHARSYPRDCLRFFDLVVMECDKPLINDILRGRFDPGSIISAAKPFEEVPSVEERMPEIRVSSFLRGKRPFFATTVPLLASMGCPYACNFCVDWNNPYRMLPLDRLAEDLRFLARSLPSVRIAYHDPNFAVKFDQVLGVMEALPPESRNPYIMESSLSNLRGSRVRRLRETNCVMVAPGIESWSEYSNKAGVGRSSGLEKVERVVEHCELLHESIPYIQANFIFGLDVDEGDEPVELTKEFMTRTPFVWPVVNIPHPFGATPLHQQYIEEGRILTSMPFLFYYSPYTVTTIKHYDPVTYYEKLIDIFSHSTSMRMLQRRLRMSPHPFLRLVHVLRTMVKKQRKRAFMRLREMLVSDRQFLSFHEGRSKVLPEFYHREYERMLGPYAELISRVDRIPELGGTAVSPDHPAGAGAGDGMVQLEQLAMAPDQV